MARTRSIASIESEIQKTEAELSALSKKYDETAERLPGYFFTLDVRKSNK